MTKQTTVPYDTEGAFELTDRFRASLIEHMEAMCAMMRDASDCPECWVAGRCRIVDLATGPRFEYGPAEYFTDGLGAFAVVLGEEPATVVDAKPKTRPQFITRSEAYAAEKSRKTKRK